MKLPPHPLFRIARKTLVVATGLLLAATAPAANPTGSSAPVALEAFTVTGSNIRRVDAETALPVTIFEPEDFAARGVTTPADLFETVTMANPPILNETNSAGQSARGDNVGIDLRGLGSGSTLTLVNGRRMPAHPISASENGTPSFTPNGNSLPGAFASRVELLRDGASAIYGSEAAAGVVNYLVTPGFDGLRTSFRGSATLRGGGGEYQNTFTWGSAKLNGGKTRISVGLHYINREGLAARDRWFSSNDDIRRIRKLPAPWNGLPFTSTDIVTGATTTLRSTQFNNSSTTVSSMGNFARGTLDSSGNFTGARPASNLGISTSTTPGLGASLSTAGLFFVVPLATGETGFRQTTPSRAVDSVENDYYQNNNQFTMLIPKSHRFNVGIVGDHRINARLTAYGEALFYYAKSDSQRAPIGMNSANDNGLYAGIDNPYNPFGSRFYAVGGAPNADGTPRFNAAPGGVRIVDMTPVRDFRPRVIKVESTSYRGVAGLRGKMDLLGRSWNWDTGLLWGAAHTQDAEYNNIRESKLREALLSSDPAKAFNPFGYTFKRDATLNQMVLDRPFTNNRTVVDGMTDNYKRAGWTQVGVLDLKVDGRLWELWGNDLFVAGGVEVRHEGYKFVTPPYAGPNPDNDPNPFLTKGDNDFVGLSPNDNQKSNRKVYSVFAEVYWPIVTPRNDLRFARSLDLTLAVRGERFPTFGDAVKPKASLGYSPVKWLKFRASANESFKAPNLVQTNLPRRQVIASGITDVYRSTVTGLGLDGSTGRTVFRSGNEKLTPEEAINYTAGVVVDVPFVKGLSFTVDAYKINQNNTISITSGNSQLRLDRDILIAETQRQLAAGTPIGSINLGSGTSAYKGISAVRRNAVTPDDIAFFNTYNANRSPADQRAVVGSVINLDQDYTNTRGRDLDGLDLGITYKLPRSQTFGDFSFTGEATYRHKEDIDISVDLPVFSDIGQNGTPNWRFNTTLRWRKGNWSANWYTFYWGKFRDTSATVTESQYIALGQPSYITRYTSLAGVTSFQLVVDPTILHNFSVSYRFDRAHRIRQLRNTTVQASINNVFDKPPAWADENSGFQTGTANPRGQQFVLQITKVW
ncbi:MAG: TonB-dependent receptor [Opitutaceae bacterium]|nr:TonB-dependent receptor [Opitutaceae bacterium]